MKRSILLLTGAVMLLSATASAKVRVTKYAITIDEPANEQNAAALAEFPVSGGLK